MADGKKDLEPDKSREANNEATLSGLRKNRGRDPRVVPQEQRAGQPWADIKGTLSGLRV